MLQQWYCEIKFAMNRKCNFTVSVLQHNNFPTWQWYTVCHSHFKQFNHILLLYRNNYILSHLQLTGRVPLLLVVGKIFSNDLWSRTFVYMAPETQFCSKCGIFLDSMKSWEIFFFRQSTKQYLKVSVKYQMNVSSYLSAMKTFVVVLYADR